MVSSRHRRTLLFAAAVMVGVPLVPGSVNAQASSQPAAGVPAKTVTLVTGDRVQVYQRGDQQVPVVQPGAGRDGITFAVTRMDGHLQVVPSDAMALLGQGRLDRRLFDVTGLIAQGFHDSRRSDLPLLVQGRSADSVAPLADDAGGMVTRRLSGVDSVALRQPKRSMGDFWSRVARRTTKVWLDGVRRPLLDVSVPQIGAPKAWQAGFTGKGVKVAVLDTGIDATHPDLKYRIGASRNFTTASSVNDTVGHGTHVASILAGTGAASGGKYKGVAPRTTLLIGKVCRSYSCSDSAILAGMQWAAQSGAKVVNLSLGTQDTPEMDPVEQAVNDLTARYGTLFVISAGNAGYEGEETVGSPASADAALAVGAVDKTDKLAYFSSRGPRVGDSGLKPEITGPGVGIMAARAKDADFGTSGSKYVRLSGTSMSAPHVAGAAAILAQQHPGWDADELKAALVGSAKTLPGLDTFAQGAGRVDVGRAVKQPGYATPATLSIGRVQWPHHDDTPVTREVTYHNPGSQPVTYTLDLRTMGPDGEPASARMFTLSADSVTVPAGGTAKVDVTVDTRVNVPDGYYSAWLTASSGTQRVTTPVAVNKEVESYDLTFNFVDRSGSGGYHYLGVRSLDGDRSWYSYNSDDRITMRLPAGRHHVTGFLVDNTGRHVTLMVYPEYRLTRDGTMDMDARLAKPVVVKLFDPAARAGYAEVGYDYRYGDRGMGSSLTTNDLSRVSTLHLGPELPRHQMYSQLNGLWYVPDADGRTHRSPRTYHLARFEYGHFITGLSWSVQPEELAAIRTSYHSGRSARGSKLWVARPTEVDAGWASGFGTSVAAPLSRTEYLSAEGVLWTAYGGVGETALDGNPTVYQPGRGYRESWNNAVSGPGFSDRSFDGVTRKGNTITAVIPMASDGSGHLGWSYADTGTTTLYRNGTKFASVGRVQYVRFKGLPAATADYRLTMNATRSDSRYSTRLSCAWTFRSGYTDERQLLPLMTVGFRPAVDLSNRAYDGKRQWVPVTVRGAEADPVKVSGLTVEVSFDDGKTWKKVRVVQDNANQRWLADIYHPTGKTYVSLRTKAVDNHGNTVKETIIRAYGLK